MNTPRPPPSSVASTESPSGAGSHFVGVDPCGSAAISGDALLCFLRQSLHFFTHRGVPPLLLHYIILEPRHFPERIVLWRLSRCWGRAWQMNAAESQLIHAQRTVMPVKVITCFRSPLEIRLILSPPTRTSTSKHSGADDF